MENKHKNKFTPEMVVRVENENAMFNDCKEKEIIRLGIILLLPNGINQKRKVILYHNIVLPHFSCKN